jgi:hypothetical protein
MATRQNARKSAKRSPGNAGSKSTTLPPKGTVPPKEEVGRWESEGGAPQGGRNRTAIKEGQAGKGETAKPRQVSRQLGKGQPKRSKPR